MKAIKRFLKAAAAVVTFIPMVLVHLVCFFYEAFSVRPAEDEADDFRKDLETRECEEAHGAQPSRWKFMTTKEMSDRCAELDRRRDRKKARMERLEAACKWTAALFDSTDQRPAQQKEGAS